MKGCGCIGETIRYNEVFKKAKWCPKCCFPLVTLLDAEVTISRLQVNDQEYFATLDMIEEIMDQRYQVEILFGYGIEAMVVDTKAKFSSLLVDE
jgi:hypothetical protein